MVDAQNALWIAKYSVKTSSIPDNFSLSPDLIALRTKPIQAHNFHRELEILGKLADKADQKEKAAKEEQERAAAASAEESKAKEEEQTKAMADAAAAAAIEAAKPTQEQIVTQMKERTGQEEDVCYFYLESVAWDLEAAIEMMKSMGER